MRDGSKHLWLVRPLPHYPGEHFGESDPVVRPAWMEPPHLPTETLTASAHEPPESGFLRCRALRK